MTVNNHVTLQSIDLQIKSGEFLAIIGEVGSGKSSLINALIGDMIHMDPETFETFQHSELSQ
jgi:ABC-type phosphate/phosphonate transport system ATPase subunit